MEPNILLLEGDPEILSEFSSYLTDAGYLVRGVSTLAEGREAFSEQEFDALILDASLPDGDGLDWLSGLRSNNPLTPFITMTAEADEVPDTLRAIRLPEDYFLTKPISVSDLEMILKKSLDKSVIRRKFSHLQRLEKKVEPFFGNSVAINKMRKSTLSAAKREAPILILGEMGVGKGMIARWIHDSSPRSQGIFVEINCSTLKGELLAGELFGHVRGVFTGAVEDNEALIEVADGGTLFLDEICEMDLGVQAWFLKVIEEKTFRRIGESMIRRSDFRLLCASSRDLKSAAENGRFLPDLYDRIKIKPIYIPPLRERPEEIEVLANHILKSQLNGNVKITPEAIELLKAYPWPGNVRGLKNILERSLILSGGRTLMPEHFPGLKVDPRSLILSAGEALRPEHFPGLKVDPQCR